jgi:hypothetical protein
VYGTDCERQGVAAGDVDADGIDDVILGDGGLAPLDGLRVMLATARGGLQEPIVSGSDYQYADHLQPVRLDGDRFVDLVSVGGTAEGDGSANPRAWVGDGHGRFRTTFAPEHPENTGTEMFVSRLDFDDDGVQDIVAWFYEDEPFIRFFRGAGDGTFRRAQVTTPRRSVAGEPGDRRGRHRRRRPHGSCTRRHRWAAGRVPSPEPVALRPREAGRQRSARGQRRSRR